MSVGRPIELLAPGGDVDCIKAALVAGADAIYCGLDRFNARNRAENISLDQLYGIIRLAHQYDCQVFLTLNIIIVDSEIPALIGLLNKLVNTGIDAVIVQDLGLLYLLKQYFPTIAIHASTQLTTHNKGQIEFLSRFAVSRVNLCRELSVAEIEDLTGAAHRCDMLTEVFVHGSYCLGFSGLCYMSSVKNGNSGNRGRCSQPCRSQYQTTPIGRDFPLNLKDNAAFGRLGALLDAGVDSIKIEGRIKKSHYVYTVVESYRRRLQSSDEVERVSGALYTVFNRDFSDGFLQGEISADLGIDNPRDHSALHYAGQNGLSLEAAKRVLYDTKTEIIHTVQEQIAGLSIEKSPLTLTLSGKAGTRLKVRVENADRVAYLESDTELVAQTHSGKGYELNEAAFLKRFKIVADSAYYIERIYLENLESGLFIPFKELTILGQKILAILHTIEKRRPAVTLPVLPQEEKKISPPSLSVLIDSPDELALYAGDDTLLYYQIPSRLQGKVDFFVALFKNNPRLIPWFQPIIIADELEWAMDFLRRLQPEYIVTNNTGIAHGATELGIYWVSGPHLNIVNSFSLLALQEDGMCRGAFVSNEISRRQIQRLTPPSGFQLYYSLYHPQLLMTSRHCLFQSVVGCRKDGIDEHCIGSCQQRATIDTMEDRRLYIEKSEGNYHGLYHDLNFLNLHIAEDMPGKFTGYCIDLRDIQTGTDIGMEKAGIVELFRGHIGGNQEAAATLNRVISGTDCSQYERGI